MRESNNFYESLINESVLRKFLLLFSIKLIDLNAFINYFGFFVKIYLLVKFIVGTLLSNVKLYSLNIL